MRDWRWQSTLLLLLWNDWVLKGSAPAIAWLPPITGKLSDLCGLVVAPVLCAVCVQRLSQNRWASIAAFWLPVVVFVALNLSEEVAEHWMAVGRSIGLPQRVWTDPTDLLALPAVWLGWRIWSRPRPWTSRQWDRVMVAMGALACLATSAGWEGPGPGASLRNVTEFGETFTIRRLAVPLDCTAETDAGTGLPEKILLPPEEITLDTGEQTPLTPARWLDAGTSSPTRCPESTDGCDPGASSPCGIAIVSARGLDPILIEWDLRDVPSRPVTAEEGIAPGSLYVERFGSTLRASPGEGMRVSPWSPSR